VSSASRDLPDLTMCVLCAGDTLGPSDDHPGGQGARVRALAAAGLARLTEIECLDVCESDVLVVKPSVQCRRAGAGPVWLSQLAGEAPTAALAGYLQGGGPGALDVPAPVRAHVVPAPGDAT
jgi:hypothetical protein